MKPVLAVSVLAIGSSLALAIPAAAAESPAGPSAIAAALSESGHIAVSPPSVAAGGSVTVSGTCPTGTALTSVTSTAFAEGQARIDLTNGTAFIADGTVSSDAAARDYSVTATCTGDSGTTTVTGTLTVKSSGASESSSPSASTTPTSSPSASASTSTSASTSPSPTGSSTSSASAVSSSPAAPASSASGSNSTAASSSASQTESAQVSATPKRAPKAGAADQGPTLAPAAAVLGGAASVLAVGVLVAKRRRIRRRH